MNIPVVPLDDQVGGAESLDLPPEAYSERKFYAFRNALLGALRPFGSVGPMGDSSPDEEPVDAPIENVDPDFFFVEDRWNEFQMLVRVETSPSRIDYAA